MSKLRRSSYTFSLLALAAGNALAQGAGDPEERGTALREISVIGSHIRRVDMETQHPVLVIEREEMLRTGLTAIADILQTINAGGQSLNRNVNNGGTGEQRLNLRSLGDSRTLILVDGHRFVSALDGGVDLSSIPLAIVERVEVLKDGASAIYGSDAIAGVVNIVTRRDYRGGEASLYYGENSHGDGRRRAYDATWGDTGDGWSVAAGVGYSDDDPIFARDRDISRVPFYRLPVEYTGSSITTNPNVMRESTFYNERLRRGRDGTSPDDFLRGAPFDRYNYALRNYLQTPQERRSIFAQGRYEITPDLALSAKVFRNERRSAQQLAEPTVSFSPFSEGPDGELSISPDNVYNPFDEPVIGVTRRFAEAGPRRFEQKSATTRAHVGVDGLARIGSREFTWGVDYTATRTTQRATGTPYADNSKMALALGPSFFDASGVARCGTPDAPIAGCVPLNLFGPLGSLTPEMLDYVVASVTNRKRSESKDFAAHAEGVAFDLPAGGLGVAIGYEHRKEDGYDHPDELIASGNANGTGSTYRPTSGSYSVDEAWLELNVPLLGDAAFARQLEVSLASRYSDYSAFGGTTNSQAGLRWKPVDDVLVRSNIAQGFRAPSVLDLYAGASTQVAFVYDPCAAENDPSSSTLARCAALGVPVDVAQPEGIASTVGGNRELQPERALSRSLGLVWSPSWIDGLTANVDWFRVQIRDAISSRSEQAVVDDCYQRGDTGACARVRRNPDGTIAHVLATQQNVPGGLETEGFDFGLNYRLATRVGDFSASWDNTYVSYAGELHQPRRGSLLPDGSPAQGNVVGDYSNPNGFYGIVWRIRSTLNLHWQRDAWDATIGARYFSATDEACSGGETAAALSGDDSYLDVCSNPTRMADLDGSGVLQPAPQNRVPSVTYIDLEAGWVAPWKGRFAFGMRNAFDRDPPVSYAAFANSFFSDYEVPGRFWYASYRQAF
ncbi:TonB-dependent receptor plug domain-containing protein [Tahibacter soli]|uniref:TonB-dependent receptor n=1 Tax=Tahibacter soli TaxID=2983605 RepID=A0A9X3YT80_9GAMM|nr:TonB-dependent receptor [Tahibacter soli]MDC8016006.1 TonB-dependent receptor [Tahibacter soli]